MGSPVVLALLAADDVEQGGALDGRELAGSVELDGVQPLRRIKAAAAGAVAAGHGRWHQQEHG
jgi:hypothetical protein